MSPQLHRELADLARTQSSSLNALIEGILEKKVSHDAERRSSSPGKARQAAPVPKTKAATAFAERKRLAKQRVKEKRNREKQAQATMKRLKEDARPRVDEPILQGTNDNPAFSVTGGPTRFNCTERIDRRRRNRTDRRQLGDGRRRFSRSRGPIKAETEPRS